MRRGWKRVAERAAKPDFAPEEIRDALVPALAQDWNNDVPTDLVRGVDSIFGDQQDLFKDQIVSRLESLRPITAGRGFGKLFLDCAIKRATTGHAGPEAPIEAASNALAVRASRGAHQVEEHYCRNPNTPRAQRVRARIEQGIAGALHVDHLAGLAHSPANAEVLSLNALQLSQSCKLPSAEARARLDRLLAQRETEWKGFMQSLGPNSFVANWAINAQ